MCGLVGVLSFEGSPFAVTAAYLNRMRDTMVHRGPDGAGTWIAENQQMGLAHRRLAIVDLADTAAQPMVNDDSSVVVSFNGEIYNHAAIRQELKQLGRRRWKTDHSDTEVLLRAYEQWGIDCVHRFRGMFAFGLWDARSQTLWLVRDRLGIKPLYYSQHHGRLTFASEIKALLADPEQKRAVDEEAFFHYLSFLTTPAPMTLFEGIRKLPAGSMLRVRPNGSCQMQRYWDVWNHTSPLIGVSEAEIAARVIEELKTAVRLRKMGDVPLGVFLSGGMDSSTNAALFSEGEGKPIKTFYIGYDGNYTSYQNELHFARLMARDVGADYHEQLLKIEDLIRFLPQMVHLQDEPIADPVCVPVYYVAKLARDNGVIVCQVGEGADELFWGYPTWKRFLQIDQANQLPVPRSLKRLGVKLLESLGKDRSFKFEFLRRSALGTPTFWSGAEAFTEQQKTYLLSSRLKQKFKGYTSWEALSPAYQRFSEQAWDTHPLHWMTYSDLNLRLPELLLMRVDKMSMGVSLEARVPFLDHKFVELAMSIPAAMKVKDGVLKAVLKKAVRGVIPDPIINRKKQGFGVPVHEWFFEGLGDRTRQVMDDFCQKTDFLDRDAVMGMIDSHNGTQAWYLLNFALWWGNFNQES